MANPDFGTKVGAKREALGLTWTYFRNQYNEGWNGGARGSSVLTHVDGREEGPYYIAGPRLPTNGVGYSTFEKAATASIKASRARYEAAKELVTDFEAQNA